MRRDPDPAGGAAAVNPVPGGCRCGAPICRGSSRLRASRPACYRSHPQRPDPDRADPPRRGPGPARFGDPSAGRHRRRRRALGRLPCLQVHCRRPPRVVRMTAARRRRGRSAHGGATRPIRLQLGGAGGGWRVFVMPGGGVSNGTTVDRHRRQRASRANPGSFLNSPDRFTASERNRMHHLRIADIDPP